MGREELGRSWAGRKKEGYGKSHVNGPFFVRINELRFADGDWRGGGSVDGIHFQLLVAASV